MDFFTAILPALPANWLAFLATALTLLVQFNGSVSWVALAYKRLLGATVGEPTPIDTGLKARLYIVATWIDHLAVNTQKVADSKEVATLKQTVDTLRARAVEDARTIAAHETTIATQKSNLLQTFAIGTPDNDNGGTTYAERGGK